MHEAEGIDLTHSQYLALVHVRDHAARQGFDQGAHEWNAFRELEKLKLIAFHSDADLHVTAAWMLHAGKDWLYAYEYCERQRRKVSKREWGMMAVNLGGGAVLGGVVSVIVAVFLRVFLGI